MPTRRRACLRQPAGDDELAWQLVAAAQPHLSKADADAVHIGIGLGDTFEAIDALITTIAINHVPLGGALLNAVTVWLDSYRGQPAEPRLRRLLRAVPTAPRSTPTGDDQSASASRTS